MELKCFMQKYNPLNIIRLHANILNILKDRRQVSPHDFTIFP